MSGESHADELPTDLCGKLVEAFQLDNPNMMKMLKILNRKSAINEKKQLGECRNIVQNCTPKLAERNKIRGN